MPGSALASPGNGGPRPSGWTRGRAVLSVTTRGRPRQAGVPGSPRGAGACPERPAWNAEMQLPLGKLHARPGGDLDPQMWVRRAQAPPRGGQARCPRSMPGSLQPGSAGGTPECASGPRAPRPGAPPHRAPAGGGGGTSGLRSRRRFTAPEARPGPAPTAPGRLLLMARRAGAAGSRAAQRRGRAEQACPGPEPLTIGPQRRRRQARRLQHTGGDHRLPGDCGAGRAVGGRGQRQGGGPAGHGRRHHPAAARCGPGAGPPPPRSGRTLPSLPSPSPTRPLDAFLRGLSPAATPTHWGRASSLPHGLPQGPRLPRRPHPRAVGQGEL